MSDEVFEQNFNGMFVQELKSLYRGILIKYGTPILGIYIMITLIASSCNTGGPSLFGSGIGCIIAFIPAGLLFVAAIFYIMAYLLVLLTRFTKVYPSEGNTDSTPSELALLLFPVALFSTGRFGWMVYTGSGFSNFDIFIGPILVVITILVILRSHPGKSASYLISSSQRVVENERASERFKIPDDATLEINIEQERFVSEEKGRIMFDGFVDLRIVSENQIIGYLYQSFDRRKIEQTMYWGWLIPLAMKIGKLLSIEVIDNTGHQSRTYTVDELRSPLQSFIKNYHQTSSRRTSLQSSDQDSQDRPNAEEISHPDTQDLHPVAPNSSTGTVSNLEDQSEQRTPARRRRGTNIESTPEQTTDEDESDHPIQDNQTNTAGHETPAPQDMERTETEFEMHSDHLDLTWFSGVALQSNTRIRFLLFLLAMIVVGFFIGAVPVWLSGVFDRIITDIMLFLGLGVGLYFALSFESRREKIRFDDMGLTISVKTRIKESVKTKIDYDDLIIIRASDVDVSIYYHFQIVTTKGIIQLPGDFKDPEEINEIIGDINEFMYLNLHLSDNVDFEIETYQCHNCFTDQPQNTAFCHECDAVAPRCFCFVDPRAGHAITRFDCCDTTMHYNHGRSWRLTRNKCPYCHTEDPNTSVLRISELL